MLTSAGIRNESLSEALRRLVGENLMRIAFIPTAANVEEGDKGWLIDDLVNCKKLGEVDIVDISALEKNVWLLRLKRANVIFVGGGDTAYLMKCIRESGLSEEISDLLKTRVYVGISAGSIVLSKTLQVSSECLFGLYGDEVDNPPRGLGLIDFHMRPHLNSEYFPKVVDENLRKVFADFDEDVYALDDESAVVYDNGKIEIVSEGKWEKYPK